MGKKCKTDFNNVSMFAFSGTILLMCMRTRHKMRDANASKEGIKLLIFTTPVGLNDHNFPIEHAFYKILELMKLLKNFRFKLDKINPGKFTEIINEANIVLPSSNRNRRRAPNIRKNKL